MYAVCCIVSYRIEQVYLFNLIGPAFGRVQLSLIEFSCISIRFAYNPLQMWLVINHCHRDVQISGINQTTNAFIDWETAILMVRFFCCDQYRNSMRLLHILVFFVHWNVALKVMNSLKSYTSRSMIIYIRFAFCVCGFFLFLWHKNTNECFYIWYTA